MDIQGFSLFFFGILVGGVTMWVASWFGRLYEWKARRKLEKSLDQVRCVLMKQKLLCGGGHACSGGPKCKSDHK